MQRNQQSTSTNASKSRSVGAPSKPERDEEGRFANQDAMGQEGRSSSSRLSSDEANDRFQNSDRSHSQNYDQQSFATPNNGSRQDDSAQPSRAQLEGKSRDAQGQYGGVKGRQESDRSNSASRSH